MGYAQSLLEQYLENPEAVPEEWRTLFESGDAALVDALPGLARLFETLKEENGAPPPVAEVAEEALLQPACRKRRSASARRSPSLAPPPEPAASPEPDQTLLEGVAAAVASSRPTERTAT